MDSGPRTYQSRQGQVLVVAHRGASEDAPEHTTHAYDEALAQGADSLEVDLQRTRDDVLVCLHDDSLERVAGIRAAVRDLTLDELRQIDLGARFNQTHPERARPQFVGARVVTFAELLARQLATAPHVGLHVELKRPAAHGGRMEELVVAALTEQGLLPATASGTPPILVESFDPASLRRLKRLAPSLSTGLLWVEAEAGLAAGQLPDWVDVSGPNLFSVFLHPGHVGVVQAEGREVHVWTADDPQEVNALLDLGVDAIVTNRPAAVRALVAEKGLGSGHSRLNDS